MKLNNASSSGPFGGDPSTMRPTIYLDNNATTKLHPQVADELARCYAKELYNPASQHQAGREARRILEQARLSIATALGARTDAPFADRLIFTSGGTESNNLAIHGLVRQPGHILISSIEHPCILAAANMLSETGCFVEFLPVAPSGHVELDAVLSRLRSDTKLVSVMFANNETGTIQPI